MKGKNQKVINVYRNMLYEYFKDIDNWREETIYRNQKPYKSYVYRKEKITFQSDRLLSMITKVQGENVHTFKGFVILYKIIKLKWMMKHMEEIKNNQRLERIMLNGIPDEYKRSLKINSIKDKIK